MLELLRLLVLVGGVIIVTFLVLLSLPQCKLRDLLMPFVAWGFVILCGAYALSPVDLIPELAFGPFGLVDDLTAVAIGIGTAMNQLRGARQKTLEHHDPHFN